MKCLISYGLAAAIVFGIAMPAMASHTIGVCVSTADVKEDSTTPADVVAFTAAAPFFPEGTIADGTKNCPTTGAIGTFYTVGGFLTGPDTNGNAAVVTWVFIFNKGGRFVTVGIVNQTEDYFQTITGSNGGFANSGRIKVHNFTPTAGGDIAFIFSVTYP
jgi:hypothetical protein